MEQACRFSGCFGLFAKITRTIVKDPPGGDGAIPPEPRMHDLATDHFDGLLREQTMRTLFGRTGRMGIEGRRGGDGGLTSRSFRRSLRTRSELSSIPPSMEGILPLDGSMRLLISVPRLIFQSIVSGVSISLRTS